MFLKRTRPLPEAGKPSSVYPPFGRMYKVTHPKEKRLSNRLYSNSKDRSWESTRYMALDWSQLNFSLASMRDNSSRIKVEEHYSDLKLVKHVII